MPPTKRSTMVSCTSSSKVGERFVSRAYGKCEEFNDSAKRVFQLYTILTDHMTSPIPSMMSFKQAAGIPLDALTASCRLFQQDQLALQLPTLPRWISTARHSLSGEEQQVWAATQFSPPSQQATKSPPPARLGASSLWKSSVQAKSSTTTERQSFVTQAAPSKARQR
jgi:hypothetical protein